MSARQNPGPYRDTREIVDVGNTVLNLRGPDLRVIFNPATKEIINVENGDLINTAAVIMITVRSRQSGRVYTIARDELTGAYQDVTNFTWVARRQ